MWEKKGNEFQILFNNLMNKPEKSEKKKRLYNFLSGVRAIY